MSKASPKPRLDLRKAGALSLAVACASASTARNNGPDADWLLAQNSLDQPGTEPPEILRLQGGQLVSKNQLRFRNRFSISYRPSFNVTAEFRNIGFPSGNLPGPGGGLADRDYDDGYVRLETTGPATGSPDGYTSYWSYQNTSQVVGNDLLMHKASSAGMIGSSGTLDDGPQQGMEFTYNWEIGPVGRFFWGMEGAFGFSGVSVRDTRSLMADVNITTDTFDISNLELGGGPPPPPGTPSTGRSGTSAIIQVEPVSRANTIYPGSTIDGYRSVDASVYDFRVGPYVEYQLTDRLSVGLSGGLGLALVDSTFALNETLSLPGGGQLTNSGSSSHSAMLVGGYAAASVAYAFADAWRIFASAQYRSMGSFDQSMNGSEVHLDFGNMVNAAVGIGYSF